MSQGYPPPQGYPPQQQGYGPPPGPPQGYGPPPQMSPPAPAATETYNLGAYWQASKSIVFSDWKTWSLIALVGYFAAGCGFWGGYQYCYLKAKSGQKPEWRDVLYPFQSKRWLDLLIGGIVAGFGSIFTMAIWGFNTPLQMDRGLTWQQAMPTGKQQTSKGGYVVHLLFFLKAALVLFIPLLGLPIFAGVVLEATGDKFGGLQFGALRGQPMLPAAAGAPMGMPPQQPQQQWGPPPQQPQPMGPPPGMAGPPPQQQWGPPPQQQPPMGPPPQQQWGPPPPQQPMGPPPGMAAGPPPQQQWGPPPQQPQQQPPMGPPPGQWGPPPAAGPGMAGGRPGPGPMPPPGPQTTQLPGGPGRAMETSGEHEASTVALDGRSLARMQEMSRKPGAPSAGRPGAGAAAGGGSHVFGDAEIYEGKTQALEMKPVIRNPDGTYTCAYCSNLIPPDAKATCPSCGNFLIGM